MKNTKASQDEIEHLMDDLIVVLRSIAPKKHLLRPFLRSLLTPAEYRDTALRWRIVTQLHLHIPQREIAQELGVSLSKITRGSQELAKADSGFTQVLHQISRN